MYNHNKTEALYNMGEAARVLQLDLGKNQLYAYLKEQKIIRADNSPFIEYEQKGFFKCYTKIQPWNGYPYQLTLVTAKGLEFIRQLFNEGGRKLSEFPTS
ncbi:MAG: phage antirepressor KilAC domain-containing protein [Chitinophagaceae bacterium]